MLPIVATYTVLSWRFWLIGYLIGDTILILELQYFELTFLLEVLLVQDTHY